MKVKYELLAEVSGREPVAVASVNSHGQVFGTGFGITRHGGPVFSACFAVGLERFTRTPSTRSAATSRTGPAGGVMTWARCRGTCWASPGR